MNESEKRSDMTVDGFRGAFSVAIGLEDFETVMAAACRSMGSWSSEDCLDVLLDLWPMFEARDAQIERSKDPRYKEIEEVLRPCERELFTLQLRSDFNDENGLEAKRVILESERDRLRGRLAKLGMPTPLPGCEAIYHQHTRDFVQQLLVKITADQLTSDRIERLRSMLFQFDNEGNGTLLDVPLSLLPYIVAGWQLTTDQIEWGGFKTPLLYFRQLVQKAPAIAVLNLVSGLFGAVTLEDAERLVNQFASLALSRQPALLGDWEIALREKGDAAEREEEHVGLQRLADQIAGIRRIPPASAAIRAHLIAPHLSMELIYDASRAVCMLRDDAVILDPHSLQALLDRDSRLVAPHLPPHVEGLLRGAARDLALDYWRLEIAGSLSNLSASCLLTLCIERQLKESMSDGLPQNMKSRVLSAGLTAIRTFLAGTTTVEALRGLRVATHLTKQALDLLERASRYRDQLHHEPPKLPPTASEELRQMVFRKDGLLLQALTKVRLAKI